MRSLQQIISLTTDDREGVWARASALEKLSNESSWTGVDQRISGQDCEGWIGDSRGPQEVTQRIKMLQKNIYYVIESHRRDVLCREEVLTTTSHQALLNL